MIFYFQMAWLRLQANLAGATGIPVPLLLHQLFISICARRRSTVVSIPTHEYSRNQLTNLILYEKAKG